MSQEHPSLWRIPPSKFQYDQLQGDEHAEIAIIGGGLAGLLSAYWLQNAGITDIVLLEADRLGSGTSASSTGKITALHTMLYSRTLDKLKDDHGRIVADVLSKAVEQYTEIISKENIDCDLERLTAVEFSSDTGQKDALRRQFEAAARLGLQVRFSEAPLELPVRSAAAIFLENQAQFHPYKFIIGLADILQQRGLRIYEKSPVHSLRDLCTITPLGKVTASRIIVATRFPIVDPQGGFFAKMVQSREYFLALSNVPRLGAMYLDIAERGFSWRSHRIGGQNLMLFGGLPHKTGYETDVLHFPRLKEEARKHYPDAQVVTEWSAQDCHTFDDLPYFGALSGQEHRILVLTGFNKWGISSSMAGAYLLAQAIARGKTADLEPFLPKRFQPDMQLTGMIESFGDVASQLAVRALPSLHRLADLPPGHGGTVQHCGKTVGVYRDANGVVHAVNPVCSHLGCALHWNPDERSWDCPCHGSRFDPAGRPLDAPAHRPLEQLQFRA